MVGATNLPDVPEGLSATSGRLAAPAANLPDARRFAGTSRYSGADQACRMDSRPWVCSSDRRYSRSASSSPGSASPMTAPILVNGVPAQSVDVLDRGLAFGDGVFRTLVDLSRLWWELVVRKLHRRPGSEHSAGGAA